MLFRSILVAEADLARFHRTVRELYRDSPTPPIVGLGHFREIESIVSGDDATRPPAAPSPSEPEPARRHLLPISRPTAEILQIAAAGAHHFLLLGPKGVGKSLALEWFLALLPEVDRETSRTRRYLSEITGRENESPHRRIGTQVKPAALLGSFSGGGLRPGEFSLAHGGVLLADEFPEWSRDSREALREPLERRRVTLTRVDGVLELPCDFIFAGNGNLCPCGGVPDAPVDGRYSPCRCHPVAREKYLAKLGGPILDRLDLVAVLHSGPSSTGGAVRFDDVRVATLAARERLVDRYSLPPGKLSAEDLEDLLGESTALRRQLDAIDFRSFRDRHKTLRIALTLAALREREPDAEIFREARSLRIESDKAGQIRAGA